MALRCWLTLTVLLAAWVQSATSQPASCCFADEGVAQQKVKVFVLIGQSNMEGHGRIKADLNRNGGRGSLEFLVTDSESKERFSHLISDQTGWASRSDVFIGYLDRQGPLKPGFGVSEDHIGPELGFGTIVGNAIEDPVLLIKCAWGGKSLAIDFRPPSSGPVPYSLGEKGDAELQQDPDRLGKYYRLTLAEVKSKLELIPVWFPQSKGQYEIAGIAWHQGWNDRINDQFNREYAANLANFIRDIRKELHAPELPFVIAETGMNGPDETHPRALSLMKAQADVARMEEFRTTVGFVPTQRFWRPATESPSQQGYHWNSNAETYYLIGEALGHEMLRLSAPK